MLRRILASHPFLLLGLVTYGLFLTVEAVAEDGPTGPTKPFPMPVLRVLIIPMYFGWLLVTIAAVAVLGPHWHPAARRVVWVLQIVAGFVPYLLADALLRWRRRSVAMPAA
jgi:hypothetical protein